MEGQLSESDNLKMMNWDLVNTWDMVLPPSRPSSEQLYRIQMIAHNMNRNVPVAILGSTPEFRDLLRRMDFKKIFIFDKNREFYNKMTQLMSFDTKSECLVIGDWTDTLKDYQNSFGLVLSDLTMGNIAYEERRNFYYNINQSLVNSGVFIDKILTHDMFLKIDQLIEEFSNLPINLYTANRFNCQMLFCSELLEKTQIVDSTYIYNYLEEYVHQEWMTKLIALTEFITPRGGLWYYGRKRECVEDDFLGTFRLKMKWSEPIGSPYYLFCHHYEFGKK